VKRLWVGLVVVWALAWPVAAGAADHAIQGGSNGSLCSSGGYFNPSSLTVASGDTVTISVPSNDPYSAGLEVHGFPEGTFDIARGGSHKTAALTANVSYYGTWPSSGCMKGSGSITVTAAPTPTPTPAPTAAHQATPTPKPAGSATPAASPRASATPQASAQPKSSALPSASAVPVATINKGGGSPTLVLGAALGGTVLVVVAGLLVVRFVVKRRQNATEPGVTNLPTPTNPPADGQPG
jgi:hypothetical protein